MLLFLFIRCWRSFRCNGSVGGLGVGWFGEGRYLRASLGTKFGRCVFGFWWWWQSCKKIIQFFGTDLFLALTGGGFFGCLRFTVMRWRRCI